MGYQRSTQNLREKATMTKLKIACFVSGPYRYCDLVLDQIDQQFKNSKLEYDVFIHLWESEQGDKVRGGGEVLALNRPGVKKIIVDKPITECEVIAMIKRKIGWFDYAEENFEGHSPINNIYGMFYGINKLYKYLEDNNLLSTYSHILRLRTDISFHKSLIPNKISDNILYVSKNPYISSEKISDHTMLVPTSIFPDIWLIDENFLQRLSEAKFNPEIYLGKTFYKKGIKSKVFLERFKDYNVIYAEAKNSDSMFVRNCKSRREAFIREHEFLEIVDVYIMKVKRTIWKVIRHFKK